MKKVFLDLGANKGQSINYAIKTILGGYDYVIHSFETLPLLANSLKEYFATDSRVHVHHLAAWDTDEVIKFYVSPKSTESGTLLTEKKTGGITPDTFIRVQGIDFSRWVKENIDPEDYNILKFDIEGAEYRVLRKLIEDGTIGYFNEFLGEFHYDKITVETNELVELVNYVHDYFMTNDLKFKSWEVGSTLALVDYKQGTRPSLASSKVLKYTEDGKEVMYKEPVEDE